MFQNHLSGCIKGHLVRSTQLNCILKELIGVNRSRVTGDKLSYGSDMDSRGPGDSLRLPISAKIWNAC